MLRVVRVCVVRDSLCISLESDTHTHTKSDGGKTQEMGKTKKNGKLFVFNGGQKRTR